IAPRSVTGGKWVVFEPGIEAAAFIVENNIEALGGERLWCYGIQIAVKHCAHAKLMGIFRCCPVRGPGASTSDKKCRFAAEFDRLHDMAMRAEFRPVFGDLCLRFLVSLWTAEEDDTLRIFRNGRGDLHFGVIDLFQISGNVF